MKKQIILGMVLLVASGIALSGCSINQEAVAVTVEEAVVVDGEAMTKEEPMSLEEVMKNDGKLSTDFELISVSGETVSLESFKGEKVYVKFWASWCSICLAGLDELDTLSANAEGFKVISIVSPGYSGELSNEKFVEWFNSLNYENLVVLLDEGGDVAKKYGVRGYPTSGYIGSDGILVKSVPGHVNNDAIVEAFKEIY